MKKKYLFIGILVLVLGLGLSALLSFQENSKVYTVNKNIENIKNLNIKNLNSNIHFTQSKNASSKLSYTGRKISIENKNGDVIISNPSKFQIVNVSPENKSNLEISIPQNMQITLDHVGEQISINKLNIDEIKVNLKNTTINLQESNIKKIYGTAKKFKLENNNSKIQENKVKDKNGKECHVLCVED